MICIHELFPWTQFCYVLNMSLHILPAIMLNFGLWKLLIFSNLYLKKRSVLLAAKNLNFAEPFFNQRLPLFVLKIAHAQHVFHWSKQSLKWAIEIGSFYHSRCLRKFFLFQGVEVRGFVTLSSTGWIVLTVSPW